MTDPNSTALPAALDEVERLKKELSRWIRNDGETEKIEESLNAENRRLRARVAELEAANG